MSAVGVLDGCAPHVERMAQEAWSSGGSAACSAREWICGADRRRAQSKKRNVVRQLRISNALQSADSCYRAGNVRYPEDSQQEMRKYVSHCRAEESSKAPV